MSNFHDIPISHLRLPKTYLSKLYRLKIQTLRDLIYYFPKTHTIFKRTKLINVREGEFVTIIGYIQSHQITTARSGKLTIQRWVICNVSKTASIQCTHFHHHDPYQSEHWREEQRNFYRIGRIVTLSGKTKIDSYTNKLAIDADEVRIIDLAGKTSFLPDTQIQPAYPLTRGVTTALLQECLRYILNHITLADPLPFKVRKRYDLIDLQSAITEIHFPQKTSTLKAARQRLIFDEFFYLQLGLLQRRQVRQQSQRQPLILDQDSLRSFYQALPFSLTHAQQQAISEIHQDLQSSTPMNRLLQGDVGSGKTVVASAAIAAVVQAGYQAALMVPTEVLANQHYQTLCHYLQPLNCTVALLTGSTSSTQRTQIYQALQSGILCVVVGTHALIQEVVQFNRLALAVIDEQHRFGVEQRELLQKKGDCPHLLSMTATPIPRSLALTLYGDLEISSIHERPPGRQPVQTAILDADSQTHALQRIQEQISQGHQAYIILTLVEESEKTDLKAAIAEHRHLQTNIFPQFQVGLLHGKMSAAEKEAAIKAFQSGQTQILVATTVVEVGIDTPNATVIAIEHAERFGLSQLHQLRGRVGRGNAQSYCYLINYSTKPETFHRLQILESSQNGFDISDHDLKFRGPGEILGTAQTGVPDFVFADVTKHQTILLQAREAAALVLDNREKLRTWELLNTEMQQRYQLQATAC